jgi:tetratricopeptide (TPR) repeat protein
MRRVLSKRLTDIARTLPPSDDASLYARSLEIAVLISEGNFEAAESLARAHHANVRALFGDEHEQALVAAGVVGVTLMRQLKFDAAAQIQREVLEAERRAGRMDKAISLMEAYATTLQPPPTDINTTDIKSNFAYMLGEMGEHAESEGLYREVHASRVATLGADHKDTRNARRDVVCSLLDQRRYDEALAMEREELAKRRLAGDDGPSMWVHVTNIARILDDTGAHADAEALWREVHAHHAAAFGEADQRAINVLGALVMSIWAQKTRNEEAIDTQRRLVALSRDRAEEATLRRMVAEHRRATEPSSVTSFSSKKKKRRAQAQLRRPPKA